MPSFTTVLGLVGALQGLILALAIASVPGSTRRPNRALALVVFTLALAVAAITIDHSGFLGPPGSSRWAVLPILLEHSATFLFAPAFWRYTLLVLGERPRIPMWVHWFPFLLWSAYLAGFTLGWTTWRWLPPILGVLTYLMGYTIAVALRVWRRGREAKTLVHHVQVLRLVVYSLVLLHLAQATRYVGRDVAALTDVVPLTATLGICLIAVFSFRQSRLFAGFEASPVGRKYASSTLTEEGAAELANRLQELLREGKPHLNESLTLADLAQRLKVPRAHLSQAINDNLGTTFAELIRRHRVEDAERLLADPAFDHLTVESIGYEVGFGSRSGFHSAFKGLRGITPAQARAQLSPNASSDTRETHDR